MRASLLLVGLAFVPMSLAADEENKPPKGWKEYSPRVKSFSVWLPDKGGRKSERDRTLKLKRGGLVRVNLVQLELNDGSTYSAGVVSLGASVARIPVRERVEFFRDAYVNFYKGKIEKEADVKQGSTPAKEYTITTGRGLVRLRLLTFGTRLYQASVEGDKKQVQSKDADLFLNSFRLSVRASETPPSAGSPGTKGGTPQTKDPLAGKAATVVSGELFGFLKSAVKDKRLADTEIKGFTLTDKVYRDACAEGGVLIGLQVGLKKLVNKNVVAAFRPIYLTTDGEAMGSWIGPKPDNPVTVKAKPGYVVAGLTIRTGLAIDGLSLSFAKLEKNRLQMNEHYESDWIGNDRGGRRSTLPGQGYFFVGICGHLNGENVPCSLGLIAVLRTKD